MLFVLVVPVSVERPPAVQPALLRLPTQMNLNLKLAVSLVEVSSVQALQEVCSSGQISFQELDQALVWMVAS